MGRNLRYQFHDGILSDGGRRNVQLRRCEPGPIPILDYIQEVPADVCRGTNVCLRNGDGMVLLDLADGVRRAMELSDCLEEWIYAKQGI